MRSAAPVTQNHLSKPEDRTLQMQPFSGNLRPDLLTSLVNMSLIVPATRNASLQIIFKCPTPANILATATKPARARFAHFLQGAESLAHATQNHILTSMSGPRPSVFLYISLPHVLRATTACTFSTSQLPKMLRAWCVLCILTSKCASRHSGVQFFISHLPRWLPTRRFCEPTFRPSGATNH